MLDFFSNILPQLNDKNSFQTLGEKIWPLVLNSPVTFVPGSVRCSSALCLYIFLLNHLPVCVHVYQCMYMSTSVCTCLPVYVHVYQCVYMFTSVCKCLSSWSGPINRYAYIRNTDTKYIFPTDITIENKYMCVCVCVCGFFFCFFSRFVWT